MINHVMWFCVNIAVEFGQLNPSLLFYHFVSFYFFQWFPGIFYKKFFIFHFDFCCDKLYPFILIKVIFLCIVWVWNFFFTRRGTTGLWWWRNLKINRRYLIICGKMKMIVTSTMPVSMSGVDPPHPMIISTPGPVLHSITLVLCGGQGGVECGAPYYYIIGYII